MKSRLFFGVMIVLVACAGAPGCSGGSAPAVPQSKAEPQSNGTAEAIKSHAHAPIHKARAAANAGEDRLEAMDRAIKSAN